MVLGFDFGMKYIGIASGQLITKTATPLTTIKAKDGIPNWDEIATLINKWSPEALIIGYPLNMDGSQQHLSHCAKKFANRLHQKFKLPIHLVDERLSSWEVKSNQESSDRQDFHAINAQSAAIILAQWLKNQ